MKVILCNKSLRQLSGRWWWLQTLSLDLYVCLVAGRKKQLLTKAYDIKILWHGCTDDCTRTVGNYSMMILVSIQVLVSTTP
jgi:hypothetical protein